MSRGRNPLLPEADRAEIESRFQRMPVFSGTLQFLRKSREHGVRMQPEEIFQHVLAVLWVSLVEPVVCSLKLGVGSFYNAVSAFWADDFSRNLKHHQIYVGAPLGCSRFFQYTRPEYTMMKRV